MIFRKCVIKIQVLCKSDKNKGHFTWRPIYLFFSYLAHFFLEWEMFRTNVAEKIKTHFVFSNFFFSKIVSFMRKCGKKNIVDRGRPQIKTWRMRIACWIPKATNTHTQVVYYSLLFHYNNGWTNALQCYVIHTLPILLCSFLLHTRFCYKKWTKEEGGKV